VEFTMYISDKFGELPWIIALAVNFPRVELTRGELPRG
jgi:hypothetical protein